MTETSLHDTGNEEFLDQVLWNSDGLIPVIAQDYLNNDILMVAWMNREALVLSVAEQRAVYWSRSRKRLWRKGEESGNVQSIKEIRIDCDEDVIILKVEQLGGIACHTGTRSCFYRKLDNGVWKTVEKVIKDPKEMYTK
ncbi:phosphoribosyl-AMP cyclohydrolase [marine gamma proteobacterium HTCC2143]|mgnify:CR=1 FL=1|jgi:phosphoribosyl-AMP cyclohydrolase|uniref:Phosphoribosyl-AMP cyclohydrolase n=1 Tax=marine gamma proteobacterium HTCC2143 TaxID=247633 RepID=A0Y8Y2_9GAMM|nr:phosphoribosyl-AMP cyclohydrolase [marine gamma proteobacterium HTCC2143]|tara:strand:+ start:7273 stop:7689 length:417 start_codon:yes stop_codon:yes gene_type:complete